MKPCCFPVLETAERRLGAGRTEQVAVALHRGLQGRGRASGLDLDRQEGPAVPPASSAAPTAGRLIRVPAHFFPGPRAFLAPVIPGALELQKHKHHRFIPCPVPTAGRSTWCTEEPVAIV